MDRIQGRIVRVIEDKGFGFIKTAEKEYFFHRTDLRDADFSKDLETKRVNFIDVPSAKGPRAAQVELS